MQHSSHVGNSRPGYARPVISLAPNVPPNTPANTPNPDIVVSSPSPHDKIHFSHVATDSESQGISTLEAIDKAFSSIIIEHEHESSAIEIEEQKPVEITEIATSQIINDDDSGGITNHGFVPETVSSTVVISSQTEITSVSQSEPNDENSEKKDENEIISSETIVTSSTSTKIESIETEVTSSSTNLSQSATSGPISAEQCKLISSEIASHFAQKDAADNANKQDKSTSNAAIEPMKMKTTLVASSSEPSTVEKIEIGNLSTEIVATSSALHGISNPVFVDDELLTETETNTSESEAETVEKRVDFDVVKENRESKVFSLHPTKRSSDATTTFESFKDFVGGIMSSAIKAISPSSVASEPQFEANNKENSVEVTDVTVENNLYKTETPIATEVDSTQIELIKSDPIEKDFTIEVKTYAERTAKQNAATAKVNEVDALHEPKIIDDISQLKSSEEHQDTSIQILSNSSTNFGLSSPALIREILTSKTEVVPSKSDGETDLVSSSVLTDSITFVDASDTGLHEDTKSSTIEVLTSEPQIDYDDEATVSTVIKTTGPIIVEVSTSEFHPNVSSLKSRSEFTNIETITTSSSMYYEVKSTSHGTVINSSSHEPIISQIKTIPSVNKRIDYSSFDVD